MSRADEPTRAAPLPEDTQLSGRPEELLVVPREQAVTVAGRYRLDALIGRGGTAEVWRAMDTALDRTVALKLVTVAHDGSSARAADEARTLAQLSHASLVQVYDAGTDEQGRPWVVMELVDGETLADAIRRGPLPPVRVAELGLVVAEGLEHVHARGLVHRDVKPANILMGSAGRVRLTDFGIARLVDAAKVTSTGMMVGTASYLAPEQVAGELVGPPADIYSLGLALLEALTGRREYDGGTVEVALARLSRPPYIPDDLPAGWGALLNAMTAREARVRPAAAQVAVVLRGLASGTSTRLLAPTGPLPDATVALPWADAPLPAEVVVPTAQRPYPEAPRRRSHAGLWVTLVLLAALAAGGTVLLLGRDTSHPARTPAPVSTTIPQPLRHDLEILRQLGTAP